LTLPVLLLSLTGALLCGCAGGPRVDEMSAGGQTVGEDGELVVSAQVKEQYAEALLLLDQAEYAEAVAMLDQVIVAQPTLAGPRINLGIALARDGDLDAAQTALLGAVEQRPEAAEAWNELGVVYRRMGRFLSAQEAYETALSHAPDYAMAHFNLGVLFDLYLRKPADALAQYQQYRSLASEPDAQVDTWISDLERRVEADQRTAGVVDENL
jgi:tetratricopeptide (TPR) repeat protein